jgi:hypothetical protein
VCEAASAGLPARRAPGRPPRFLHYSGLHIRSDEPTMPGLENDLCKLNGVGPKPTEMLEPIGVDSIKELSQIQATADQPRSGLPWIADCRR